MNTETTAPANLTVAQLGQVLAKSNAGKTASPDPKTPATTAAPVTSREPLPPEDGPEATEAAPDLSQTENAEETAEVDGGDTPPLQGEDTPTPGDDAPAKDDADPAPPPAPTLPKELADAIEIAKGDGKKGVAQLLQRVNKLVDQRDTERNKRLELEAAKTELEMELETARGQKSEASNQRPDQSHPAVAKVNAALAEVDGFIRLFRANPNGVEIPDGNGGTTQLDADAVAEHLDQLRDKRTELLTERKLTEQTVKERFAQQHAQSHALAVKVYPWLTQPEAPEQARMKQLLKVLPGLKELPDYELVVGHYIRGEAAALAEAKAKGQKPVTQKAPPSREPTKLVTEAPGSKAGPADAKATAVKAVKAAEARFKETGKREDLQRLESAKQHLKRVS